MHALGRATVVLAGLSACALVGSIPAQGAWAAGHPAGGQTVRPDGAALAIFRVDVSRYPQVGLVVTAPGAAQALPGADFTVTVGHRTWHPSVRRLSRRDLELVLVPAADLGSAAMRAEQAAAARFLTGLPAGAQTAAVDPAMPGVLPGTLTGDPAPSVTQIASLVRAGPTLAAASLATALSAFTPGPRVRRTVVLVVSGNQSLSTAAAGFRRRLAASGTELYVLDAVPGGAAGYDALAAGSGGFAGRIRVPADWGAVFSSISRDLSDQYYLRFTDTGRLPGQVTVTVRTGAGMALGTADLPVSNPVAPPSAGTEPPPPGLPSDGDTPLLLLAVLLIVVGVGYGMGMLAASRRDPRPGVGRTSLPGGGQGPAGRALPRGRDDLFFVFMLPCLNEEKVILASLRRLLSISGTISSSSSSTTARTTPPPMRSPASSASGSGCSAASCRRHGRARARLSTRRSATSPAAGAWRPRSGQRGRGRGGCGRTARPAVRGACEAVLRRSVDRRGADRGPHQQPRAQPAGADAGHGIRHLHRGVPAWPPPPGKRRTGRQRPVHAAFGDHVARAQSVEPQPHRRPRPGRAPDRRGLAYGLLPDGRRASAGRRRPAAPDPPKIPLVPGAPAVLEADPGRAAQCPAAGPRRPSATTCPARPSCSSPRCCRPRSSCPWRTARCSPRKARTRWAGGSPRPTP